MKTLADMVAAALSVEGYTANPGRTPEGIYDVALYERVIARGETDARATEMARMSSCALAVCGLWAMLGVEHPRLAAPYRTGHAVANVAEIAREAGALLEIGSPILPGHVLIVQGPEHVLTVVEVDGGTFLTEPIQTVAARSGDRVVSIDGGIRDPDDTRYYSIQRCVRTLNVFDGMGPGAMVALESYNAEGRLTMRRAVSHHIDCAKVFAKFGKG